MGKKPNTVNVKKEAGAALKAENEAKKQAEKDRQRAAAEATEWQQGANTRKATRDEVEASKADEAARKRQEKAALLAAEEEAIKGGSAKKAAGGVAQKKKGPKSDLAMLEDALQSSADKKVKMKRQELLKKKEHEQQRVTKEEVHVDPLMANTDSMIGVMDEDLVGRQANRATMLEEGASGIDAALEALNVSSSSNAGGPAKSAKALYNEFEARMLPVVKEEFPGLRLSQYKEKVWQLWRKSPENPANQVPLPSKSP